MRDKFSIFKCFLCLAQDTDIFIIICFCRSLGIRHINKCKCIILRRTCLSQENRLAVAGHITVCCTHPVVIVLFLFNGDFSRMTVRLLNIIGCHQHQIQLQFRFVDRRRVRRCRNDSFAGLKRRFRLFRCHSRLSLQQLYFPGLYFCSCIPGEISDAFRIVAAQRNRHLIRQHPVLYTVIRMKLSVVTQSNSVAVNHIIQAVAV